MEMNNLRVESHVAQKNRRHKLRFQQNSGDLNRQYPSQDHPQFEPKDNIIHRPFSYNPNVFPSEMLNSVARNPHILLPSGHGFVSHDQDSCQTSDSGSGMGFSRPESGSYCTNFPYEQDCNIWKPVVSSQQQVGSDHWNNISYSNAVSMNIDPRNMDLNSGHGYHQDMNNVPVFSSSPYYRNTLQQDQQVTLAQHSQSRNGSGMNQSIPCWMNTSGEQITVANSTRGFVHRNIGPLGPFTGYATVLKNSKYMKSAQELLNESCDVGFQEGVQSCHDVYSHKILEEEMSWASDYSVVSNGGPDTSGGSSYEPEFNRKKANLLYLQEEICRKYKEYLQQMQMVISSFETVAGLSTATPYVCLALKALSRHFHYVKNVLSEQLSQMKKTMGDGLCNATTSSQLKSTDHRFGKSAGFFESQQTVWRPQRGLPERAISVLKTWLFDHFLHPYPSDADKHMLATQTGLTRNQVSNWFINARVRIWKPMVEEIHTLETKALAEPNSTNPQLEGDQDPTRMDNGSLPECSRNNGVSLAANEPSDHVRNYEKLARTEYQIPLHNMDRFMSVVPYPSATFDASGLGPVSLTLGLRQNAEHVQQMRQHFGGQLIHDFVG
ncbi:BEL1-like homeodomain protein 8 isoform X2 [Rutidosis leptorrhynchoides]|uniref:BEL1-like homeodomain protein 8 isoform X2 n=1 Tax=Rutidosis leptorrhynchoides TaxID=125765 RepID=UPI003A998D83